MDFTEVRKRYYMSFGADCTPWEYAVISNAPGQHRDYPYSMEDYMFRITTKLEMSFEDLEYLTIAEKNAINEVLDAAKARENDVGDVYASFGIRAVRLCRADYERLIPLYVNALVDLAATKAAIYQKKQIDETQSDTIRG